jgi:hypothetical protein
MKEIQRDTTDKRNTADVLEKKKSKIRMYWDSKPNVGTIVNMRAVLK